MLPTKQDIISPFIYDLFSLGEEQNPKEISYI